jgi:glycosyltransferase involved in cell wall biosynthesis
MKILVHDYAGHPFQIQLSRQLAMRGHDVTHAHFTENPGPKGSFTSRPGDPSSLSFHGITIGKGYDKTSLITRRFNDVEYGRRAARIVQELEPDVVISGNTPTEAQKAIITACKARRIRFVYWLQDFYSIAVTTLLSKKLGVAGAPIGWYYRRLERSQLRNSDAVIAITDDFVLRASAWAGDKAKVSVIENWATLEDIQVGTKDNAWSREHDLHNHFNYVYSGTLGLKHNPNLLIRLAQESDQDTRVVAVAEGVGVTQLKAASSPALDTIKLLPLQPVANLAKVLATGDVLVAMIEGDAGNFAVPSKVQSYLCAGRPILLAAPATNLAARIVARENAGIVVEPGDEAGFLAAAARLRADPELRARLGANGRLYAERTFDIGRITDRFEAVLRERCATQDQRTVPLHLATPHATALG